MGSNLQYMMDVLDRNHYEVFASDPRSTEHNKPRIDYFLGVSGIGYPAEMYMYLSIRFRGLQQVITCRFI